MKTAGENAAAVFSRAALVDALLFFLLRGRDETESSHIIATKQESPVRNCSTSRPVKTAGENAAAVFQALL